MKYLIVGATGSWGTQLTKQLLLKEDTEQIVMYSRNEHNQIMKEREFNHNPKLKFVLGDIADYLALVDACAGIDVVFALAATKHVPKCEEMPIQAIKTNITGVECLIRASCLQGVSRVIYVSTDKACLPANVYGMTKAIGERLILDANKRGKTKFTVVRAGNVMGSAGSVIPLFIEQIKKDNQMLVTCKEMTRFFMTLEEAIGLLLLAMDFQDADMLVMRMPSCTIGDLAEVMAEKYAYHRNCKIIETGIRPGEKLHELLLSENETLDAYTHGDNYYKITKNKYPYAKVNFKEYGSNTQPLMNHKEIEEMLLKGGF